MEGQMGDIQFYTNKMIFKASVNESFLPVATPITVGLRLINVDSLWIKENFNQLTGINDVLFRIIQLWFRFIVWSDGDKTLFTFNIK